MEKSNQYYEIDLMQLLHAFWHRLWAIILAAVIGGGALFSYAAFFITPLYEAEALIYVNNSSFSLGSTSFSISSSELTAAKTLVDTYIVILKTRSTLSEVIREAGLNYSYQELSEMIGSEPVNNTEIFSIKVTSSNPQEA
ncbi:MAG: Wzz/FepE/Etk N-terminal domain-containing protein, partial [Lachnospiraceae bacterium]|nr:Wzz/FepE/Etk N-terminal domain-containing protein [Lachnospiraceae bacterium]